ncbi:MAG: hypothetical protein JSS72_08570 [Armatimonadetes bacterium]|nr:hypothetical protein [Armatimonadota bacterium]
MESSRITVRGIEVDGETRCQHYHGPSDILAIQFHCCGEFYSCRECHDAIADHPAQLWPKAQFESEALLCGKCGHRFSINEYLADGTQCPACQAGFNPGCRNHRHLYFEV